MVVVSVRGDMEVADLTTTEELAKAARSLPISVLATGCALRHRAMRTTTLFVSLVTGARTLSPRVLAVEEDAEVDMIAIGIEEDTAEEEVVTIAAVEAEIDMMTVEAVEAAPALDLVPALETEEATATRAAAEVTDPPCATPGRRVIAASSVTTAVLITLKVVADVMTVEATVIATIVVAAPDLSAGSAPMSVMHGKTEIVTEATSAASTILTTAVVDEAIAATMDVVIVMIADATTVTRAPRTSCVAVTGGASCARCINLPSRRNAISVAARRLTRQ